MRKLIIILTIIGLILMSGCSKNKIETADEIRNKIASLNDNNEIIECYERLLSKDELNEDEYLLLAGLYENESDINNQRRIIRKLFKLNPTSENAHLLSNIVAEIDLSNENILGFLNNINEGIINKDSALLDEIITSSDWKNYFMEEDGIIEMKSSGKDENNEYFIRSSYLETEFFDFQNDILYYLRINENGSIIATLGINNDRYHGESLIAYFDNNHELYKEIECFLDGDHCINSIKIIYEGETFVGEINDDGTTFMTQIDNERRYGNVIYAYNDNKTKYLIKNGTTVDEFIINLDFLNIPSFKR